MAYWCVLLIICLPTALSAADDRLILNAKINGDEIRLAYDTGSPASLIIFKSTAKRLRLNVAEENGKAVATFELEIGGEKIHNAKAILIDFLPFPDIEGLVGWPAFRGKLWRVQWDNMSLSLIPTLPNEILSWQVLKLDNQVSVAAAFIREDSEGVIYLDTGAPSGVSLSNSRWNEEIAEKPGLPMTLKTGYMPAAGGFFVTKLRWSDDLQIGPLRIFRVMVQKSVSSWPNLEAVLGLEALKHFEIVFDLKNYKIYMKERPYSRVKFEYNRLGATFPPASLESNRLVGHVLKNSPAYKAGLRTGDILLSVDNINMTQWRTDPAIWKKKFWSADSGTRYTLEVERHGRKHVITVVLENILNIPNM